MSERRRYFIVLDVSADEYNATQDEGFYAPDGDDPYGLSSLATYLHGGLDELDVRDCTVYKTLDDLLADKAGGLDMFEPAKVAGTEAIEPARLPDSIYNVVEHSRTRGLGRFRRYDKVNLTGLVQAASAEAGERIVQTVWPRTARLLVNPRGINGTYAFEVDAYVAK